MSANNTTSINNPTKPSTTSDKIDTSIPPSSSTHVGSGSANAGASLHSHHSKKDSHHLQSSKLRPDLVAGSPNQPSSTSMQPIPPPHRSPYPKAQEGSGLESANQTVSGLDLSPTNTTSAISVPIVPPISGSSLSAARRPSHVDIQNGNSHLATATGFDKKTTVSSSSTINFDYSLSSSQKQPATTPTAPAAHSKSFTPNKQSTLSPSTYKSAALSNLPPDSKTNQDASASNQDDDSSSSEDENALNEESATDYCNGGYHPVEIGETFKNGRYVIVRKLGWGHFSTVWLAKDTHDENRHVAMKVVRSASHYTEAAIDEIYLLKRAVNADPTHPGRAHVVSLLDSFTHEGPNGSHVCMVFEVLGENLLGLIKRYKYKGIPKILVKQITKQVLLALDYLHRECGIIHTDLKPENVLIELGDVELLLQRLEEEEAAKKLQEEELRAERRAKRRASEAHGKAANDEEERKGRRARRKSVVTGSQPLPSPLRSNSSVMLHDFAMSPAVPPSYPDSIASSVFPSKAASKAASKTREIAHQVQQQQLNNIQQHVQMKLGQLANAMSADDSAANNKNATGSEAATKLSSNHIEGQMSSISISNDQDTIMTSAQSVPQSPRHSISVNPSINPSRSPSNEAYSSTNTRTALEENLISVKIADLGNACWVNQHFTDDIQTRQYRSPEVLLGANWGASTDVWSMGCLVFELLTGNYLFYPHNSKTYSKDDDHLAQIIEYLGRISSQLLLTGKWASEYFDRRGDLRNIKKLHHRALLDVLIDYRFEQEDSKQITEFLLPMLETNPRKRADAGGMSNHEWLKDAVGFEGVAKINRVAGASGKDIDGWTKEVSRKHREAR